MFVDDDADNPDFSFFKLNGDKNFEDTPDDKDDQEEGKDSKDGKDTKDPNDGKDSSKPDKSKEEKPKDDKPKDDKKSEDKKIQDTKDDDADDEVDFSPLAEAIFSQLGIDWDETFLPKDKNNLEGYTELLAELIEENSTPQYASTLSQQFDEHLKKGGDPKKFYELYVDRPDYSKVKIETVSEQKLIVREHLKRTSKMSDARIEKFIETLVVDKEIEGEAKDALQELQKLDEAERKEEKIKLDAKIEADKKKAREDHERVMALIDKGGVSELGFELDKKTREAFKAYLFNVDSTGKTAYQKAADKIPNLKFRLAYLAFAGIHDEKSLGVEAKTKAIDAVRKSVNVFNAKKQHSTNTNKNKDKNNEEEFKDFEFFKLSNQ